VAITDGRGTVALRPGGDAHEDALRQARRIARDRIGVLVADASVPGSPEALAGRAHDLAAAARGRCVPLHELGVAA
jgi:magnesium chelatase subunit D